MSTNNDVFQILVVDPAIAPATAGETLEDLEVGQIGVFDADTNLAVNAASAPVREFFIAVGVDPAATGSVTDIDKSAGQTIQTKGIRSYNFRAHTASRPQIVEVTGYTAKCDTDYALKLEMRNAEIYRRQGANQFSQTYAVRTETCADCTDCGDANVNLLTKNLRDAINLQNKSVVTAEAITTEALTAATHGVAGDLASGVVLSDADLDAIIAFNETADDADKVASGLRITTVNLPKRNLSSAINTNYHKPLETVIIPSLVEGFGSTAVVTTTQEAASEEGDGYALRQREYHSGGFNGRPGPYRVNTATGLAREVEYRVSATAKYDLVELTYDNVSAAGWSEYSSPLNTTIGFPTTNGGSTTAIAATLTILDAILAPQGFDALADDAAAADDDPAVVEPTSGAATQNLDGIG
jgi:hypothetical protein